MTALPSAASITELVGAFQAGSTGDPDAVKSCSRGDAGYMFLVATRR